jgi:hypothetical protein
MIKPKTLFFSQHHLLGGFSVPFDIALQQDGDFTVESLVWLD